MLGNKTFVFLLLCLFNIDIYADGTSTIIVINAPQFVLTGPSSNSIDYTICGFPHICNAGTNDLYTTKPITLAPNSASLPPDWQHQNLQWHCNPNNCLNTGINQTAPSGLTISNNIIYATLGVNNSAINSTAAKVLQMTAPIPNGWQCSVTTDSDNKPIAICSMSKKSIWNCQPAEVNCHLQGICGGVECPYMCDTMKVNQYSLVDGNKTLINSYLSIPSNIRGYINDQSGNPSYLKYKIDRISYVNGQLVCDYSGVPVSYTINGKNCFVDSSQQSVVCDWP